MRQEDPVEFSDAKKFNFNSIKLEISVTLCKQFVQACKPAMSIFSVTRIFVFCFVGTSLYFCKPVEIVLHGEISGTVTDASTGLPLKAAAVILSPINDTILTEGDGIFSFGNLAPDNYEIEASKIAYDKIKKNVTVTQAETKNITFSMNGVPVPEISATYLDFGMDSTIKHFTISNSGKGKLEYIISSSTQWINISPAGGDCTNETDNITVTIDKSGLATSKQQDIIKIYSITGQDITKNSIDIYLNGVMDDEMNYYNVVRIGSQTWMAENLKNGITFMPGDDGVIDKYCYEGDDRNCNIYGGLYHWYEAMQFTPSDSGMTGIVRGACPIGWHIPTLKEWEKLIIFAGGQTIAGAKLMETGTENWLPPNTIATNETGFTALPAGYYEGSYKYFDLGSKALFWSATSSNGSSAGAYKLILSKEGSLVLTNRFLATANSVRCLKDSPQK